MRWAGARRTREILAVVLLTFLIVAATTLVHHAHVRRVVLQDVAGQAQLVARQAFDLASRSLSVTPDGDPRETVREHPEIRALVNASVAYAPHLLYVAVTGPDGRALVQSDARREGEVLAVRRELRDYIALDPLRRLYDTYGGGDEIYEVRLPLELEQRPFGAVRVGIAMPLVRAELRAALARSALLGGLALMAAVGVAVWLSQMALRPLRQLAEDMERLRRGEFDIKAQDGPADEFGKLAYQLQLLGQQIQSDRLRLRTERAQFQSAVDQIEDGILFANAEGRIVFANQAIAPVLGRSAAELSGACVDEALAEEHPLRKMIVQAFEGGAGVHNVVVAGLAESAPAEFLASVFPIEDGGQRRHSVIAVVKDLRSVAVSVRTMQSLIRYSAQLTALGRATSAIAHDIKNPLNAMMLHLEVVRQRLGDGVPAEARAGLDVISAEIGRLDGIVQRFLTLVRPQEIAHHHVELNAVLGEVASLLEAEWKAKGIIFTRALADALPAVLGDADLLRRAFMNILLNACEAMPGRGTLTISTEPDERFARVTIADTGTGIAPEDLERIFTMYYTSKVHGSGIGLALAQRIIEVHEGTIELLSELGRGTTVIVRLPAR
jgi:PAS domain S-box-containing protein